MGVGVGMGTVLGMRLSRSLKKPRLLLLVSAIVYIAISYTFCGGGLCSVTGKEVARAFTNVPAPVTPAPTSAAAAKVVQAAIHASKLARAEVDKQAGARNLPAADSSGWGSAGRKADPDAGAKCGPLNFESKCNCGLYPRLRFCNERNGWCGSTHRHKMHSSGKYDCELPPALPRVPPPQTSQVLAAGASAAACAVGTWSPSGYTSAGPHYTPVGTWSPSGLAPCKSWSECPSGRVTKFKPTAQVDRECVPPEDPCVACANILWDEVDKRQIEDHRRPVACSFMDLGIRTCVMQDCEAEGDHEWTKHDDRTHKFEGVECQPPAYIKERHISKFIDGLDKIKLTAAVSAPVPEYALSKTAAALHDQKHHECAEYGQLLQGVDMVGLHS